MKKEMKESTKLKIDFMSTLIVTLIAGAVTVVAVISMAWFASNNEVGTNGSSVTIAGDRYTISFLEGSTNGIYEEKHSLVKDPDSLVWGMTADYNLENGTEWDQEAKTGNRGIYPGSSGKISFYVTPHVENVALDFDLELIGYFYKDITPEDGDDTLSLVAISEYGDNYEKAADTLLNGHLLFFENAAVDGEDGGYTDFEDPILPEAADGKIVRTLSGRVFGDDDGELEVAKRIDIYWTWPYSLSKLVDARACTEISVTEAPFIKDHNGEETDYNAVIENIRQYPDFYMKGVSRPENFDSETSQPTEEQMAQDYVLYGDYYDQGDNEIGMTVAFVLLRMTVREVGQTSGE